MEKLALILFTCTLWNNKDVMGKSVLFFNTNCTKYEIKT